MGNLFRSLLRQDRIAGGAAVLAATSLLSSVCGFLRDQAFSITFPAGKDSIGVASVYIAAFRPSDLLFQMSVMSCLSVVLVPFLAAHLKNGNKEEMSKITTSTVIIFGSFFGTAALVLGIFFPIIAPSFVEFKGESLELYIRFGRIALLTNFLFVLGNTFGQYLITVQRYWVYGLTPVLWATSTILGTYFLTPYIGAMGPMVGTVVGTLIYVAIRFRGIVKNGFWFTLPEGGILHGEIRQMGILIAPRMLALGALQLQLLLLDRYASGLGTHAVALNQFASNFESVIPGIVGIALAQSAFSLMSQAAASKDFTSLKSHIVKGSFLSLLLSIPGALVLALSVSIAAYLMNLDGDAAALFKNSLLVYAIAVPFESTNHLLLRSFYSLKNTLFPALSSVLSCAFAISTAAILLDSFGLLALALAYVTSQICQSIFLGGSLAYTLRKKSSAS